MEKSNLYLLNNTARQFRLAKEASNDYLYLVYNEPKHADEPFQWSDGKLLTKDAYNAFKGLASEFELHTHESALISPEKAAFGRWELLTAGCIKSLFGTIIC